MTAMLQWMIVKDRYNEEVRLAQPRKDGQKKNERRCPKSYIFSTSTFNISISGGKSQVMVSQSKLNHTVRFHRVTSLITEEFYRLLGVIQHLPETQIVVMPAHMQPLPN